jgi:hypothetical protein
MFTWNIETAASAIRASDEPTTRAKRFADGASKSCDAILYDSIVTESSSLYTGSSASCGGSPTARLSASTSSTGSPWRAAICRAVNRGPGRS